MPGPAIMPIMIRRGLGSIPLVLALALCLGAVPARLGRVAGPRPQPDRAGLVPRPASAELPPMPTTSTRRSTRSRRSSRTPRAARSSSTRPTRSSGSGSRPGWKPSRSSPAWPRPRPMGRGDRPVEGGHGPLGRGLQVEQHPRDRLGQCPVRPGPTAAPARPASGRRSGRRLLADVLGGWPAGRPGSSGSLEATAKA